MVTRIECATNYDEQWHSNMNLIAEKSFFFLTFSPSDEFSLLLDMRGGLMLGLV